MSSSDGDDLESKLLRAARRILRPLVRILLRNGVGANAFQELARKVYVDVCYEEFGVEGKAQTLARVSVLTGLNRKEVARLHKLAGVIDDDKVRWTRAGRIFDGWLADPEFHSEAGFPLDLPFAEPHPSFSDLVKKHSGDMYPAAMREELLRTGALIEANGYLRMSKQGYVPGRDEGVKIDILGADVSEMIETIDFNIQTQGTPLLQYKVLADNLPEEHLAAFNEYSVRVSMNAINDIRRWLVEHDSDEDLPADTRRYLAGISMFQVNQEHPQPDAQGESNE